MMPVAERAAAKNPLAPIKMSRYIVPLIHLVCSGALIPLPFHERPRTTETRRKGRGTTRRDFAYGDKYTPCKPWMFKSIVVISPQRSPTPAGGFERNRLLTTVTIKCQCVTRNFLMGFGFLLSDKTALFGGIGDQNACAVTWCPAELLRREQDEIPL